jgi:hypothetical protein
MAKDLPYFKFFCSEWSDGDITLESYEVQGVFINVCSYYWSNECKVEYKKLLKKFRGFEKIISNLMDENIFKLNEDDTICISFLDEQQNERSEKSKMKSKGGRASAEARKLKKQQTVNTTLTESEHVLNSCLTEVQVSKEEEIKEDKIVLKENPNKFKEVLKKFDESNFENTERTLKTNKENIRIKLEEFLEVEMLTPTFTNKPLGEVIKHFRNWLNYNKPKEVLIKSVTRPAWIQTPKNK